MRPGAVKVETNGSFWWFDDLAREYFRHPKVEGPRPPGPNGEDWGAGPDSGALQDGVWHPYESYTVDEWYLRIFVGGGRSISAPRSVAGRVV